MADKYYRLVSLIVNICPLPLRDLFHLCAQNDPLFTAPYTAHDYMLFRQSDVRAARGITEYQYNKIYPQNGGQTDVSNWDITLLAKILKLLFVNQISQMSHTIWNNLDIIRGIRNDLQHTASACSVSDTDFNKKWSDIEDATLALADDIRGSAYKEDIRKEITKAKTSNMPDLGNVLLEWYKECTNSFGNKIDELHTDMKEQRVKYEKEIKEVRENLKGVSENTSSTKAMISKGSRKSTDNAGRASKRFKTVDNQQDVMRRKFSDTISRHRLPTEPISFLELSDITKKLREDHFVVVCGTRNSLYLQAALTSIKNMGYDEDRCFELITASDWWHVTFEEADCIVVVNPFGKMFFDQNKASAMSDIFDSMLSATRDEACRDFKFRDIVIISEKALLDECKKYFPHEVLKSEITILDKSHKLASKGHSKPPHLPLEAADTDDSVMTKEWKYVRTIDFKSDDEETCFISNMCMIPPDKIGVTNGGNYSLKVVNIIDRRIINRWTFSCIPKSPTPLPQDKLAVLLFDERMIRLFSIHIESDQGRAIKLNGSCFSILFEKDVFFAVFGSPAFIKRLNMQGEELSTIEFEQSIQHMNIETDYIAFCPNKISFYIIDTTKNVLLRVNMEGNMMAVYKGNGKDHPGGIVAMPDGSVYLCNMSNDTVIQMREDFTRSRVVLGRSDGIDSPSAICHWPEKNLMLLSVRVGSMGQQFEHFKIKLYSVS